MRELKACRQDADHRAILPIECDCLTDQIRVTAESSLPQAVTNDYHLIAPDLFVVRSKEPPCDKTAQHWKETGRHCCPGNSFRIPPASLKLKDRLLKAAVSLKICVCLR